MRFRAVPVPVAVLTMRGDTLTIATNLFGNDNLDPHTGSVVTIDNVGGIIFDSLLRYDGEGNLKPSLAESWEVNDDYTSVVFHLRRGVIFTDGSPFTSADAVFSIERYNRLITSSGNFKRYFKDVEALDEYTITVNFNAVYPFLLYEFTGSGGSSPGMALPKKYIEEQGDANFEKNPIGSGPYKITENIPNVSLIYEVNDTYWGEKPDFKKLVLLNVQEESARINLLRIGEADLIPIGFDNLSTLKLEPGINIKSLENNIQMAIFLQGAWIDSGEAIQNLKVRQALDYAINREEIANNFFEGYAIPQKYWKTSPRGQFYDPNWKVTPYDPEKAKSLLGEAGYPSAFQKPAIRFYTSTERPYQAKLAELIAGYWTAAGLQVQILQDSNYTAIYQEVKVDNTTVPGFGAAYLWSSPTGADYFIAQSPFYTSTGPVSFTRADTEVDEWIAEALSSTSQARREELDRKVLARVSDENKYSFGVAYIDTLWAASGKVGDWTITNDGFSKIFATIKKAK
jgi:peptide/nickel transport system substrate-binding protein